MLRRPDETAPVAGEGPRDLEMAARAAVLWKESAAVTSTPIEGVEHAGATAAIDSKCQHAASCDAIF